MTHFTSGVFLDLASSSYGQVPSLDLSVNLVSCLPWKCTSNEAEAINVHKIPTQGTQATTIVCCSQKKRKMFLQAFQINKRKNDKIKDFIQHVKNSQSKWQMHLRCIIISVKKRDEQGFFYTQRPRNVMISWLDNGCGKACIKNF